MKVYDDKDSFQYCYKTVCFQCIFNQTPSHYPPGTTNKSNHFVLGRGIGKEACVKMHTHTYVATEDSRYICIRILLLGVTSSQRKWKSLWVLRGYAIFTSHVKLLFEILDKTFRLTATVYNLALRQRKIGRLGFFYYLNLALKSWKPAERLWGKSRNRARNVSTLNWCPLIHFPKPAFFFSDIKSGVHIVSCFHSSIWNLWNGSWIKHT